MSFDVRFHSWVVIHFKPSGFKQDGQDKQDKKQEESIRAFKLKCKSSTLFVEALLLS